VQVAIPQHRRRRSLQGHYRVTIFSAVQQSLMPHARCLCRVPYDEQWHTNILGSRPLAELGTSTSLGCATSHHQQHMGVFLHTTSSNVRVPLTLGALSLCCHAVLPLHTHLHLVRPAFELSGANSQRYSRCKHFLSFSASNSGKPQHNIVVHAYMLGRPRSCFANERT
jgi:hypothetical protein